ncbi:hypothetical protein [Methylobacter sp. BBA5.1]|uniref:hypothetical protein n=1 Tax=Methylobacter sp. BBA5.1 TaxID=1495064 RepID=UPI00068E33E1|nr:hypothetical protein [Methylobacter sp. BBA5.1]
MTSKKTAAKKAAKSASTQTANDTLKIKQEGDKSKERLLTELGILPIAGNMVTANTFAKGTVGELNLTESFAVMKEEVKKVQEGDMSNVEATLAAQAVTLDKIFIEMARRAAMNMGEYLPAMEAYMKLALKAQTQCRTTLQTLAEIKNPQPVAFVKQANIAHGPQQVNNGVAPRAENFNNSSNELLEVNNGKRLDTRTTSTTSGADQDLEAVAAVNRAKNRKRQGG